MGNEISTAAGAVATTATGIAAGVTFGQVDALNNATKECAKFTGNQFMNSTVRHVGETVGTGVAVAGTAVAAGVTFGQVDALNNAVVVTAQHTAKSGIKAGGKLVEVGDGVLNGVPVVGHIKGGIHYACGDKDGGDQAMKAASRTTGVLGGGAVGILGGPAGMIAGGVAGGAAMDGITTGVESAVKGKYTPSGQIASWTNLVNADNPQAVVGGIVQVVMTPVGDAFAGRGVGKVIKKGQDIKAETYYREGPQMFRTDAQMQDFFNANKGVWPNPVLSLAEILGNLSSNLNLFLKTQLKGNVKNQLKKAIDDAIDEVRRQTASDFNTFFFLVVKHIAKAAVDPKATKAKLEKCQEFKEQVHEIYKNCDWDVLGYHPM